MAPFIHIFIVQQNHRHSYLFTRVFVVHVHTIPVWSCLAKSQQRSRLLLQLAVTLRWRTPAAAPRMRLSHLSERLRNPHASDLPVAQKNEKCLSSLRIRHPMYNSNTWEKGCIILQIGSGLVSWFMYNFINTEPEYLASARLSNNIFYVDLYFL